MSLFLIGLFAATAILAVTIRFVSCGRCFFGHRRNYVGVVPSRHGFVCNRNVFNECRCPREGYQMAHWVCVRCLTMGSIQINRQDGVYRVHFGELVPDVKEWANEDQEAS